jgi:uncharacterized membrane protein YozB (DUF420 family)
MPDLRAILPHLNGGLNAFTVVLLIAGLLAIRGGHRTAHRYIMTLTLGVSALFLASYLTYHFIAPIFVFAGHGWVRPVYYSLLVLHVILAIIVTPMVLMTAWRGVRAVRAPGSGNGRAAAHRRLARWTWPLWFVVAVSGVTIYVMLYHLYPAAG